MNKMKKYAYGVDIGGTTIKIGLFTSEGELIEKWEIPTRTEEKGKYILCDIEKFISEQSEKKNISKEEIEGIGMGIPGPVEDDGTVLGCVNLGWGTCNAVNLLNEMTGIKVKAGNDANVASLGEMWKGGGRGFSNIVMVTLGTGVGGGIVINGKILAGSSGSAGEIGHIPVKDDETEQCGCGKCGCLEQYASASGVSRTVEKYLKAHPETDTVLSDDLSSKAIFDAASQGDKFAVKIKDETGKMLGKALAGIACVVNPEAFVIGGGMSKAGDILLNSIESSFKHYAFHAQRETEFRMAELGNDAGIYGSVYLILSDV